MGQSTTARRRFLETAGGVLLLRPQTVFGSQANSTVEVGLVGCGGRGNWIAPFFPEHAGARVVAVADVLLVAGVVPDLERYGDGENRREVKRHPGQGIAHARREQAEDAHPGVPARLDWARIWRRNSATRMAANRSR